MVDKTEFVFKIIQNEFGFVKKEDIDVSDLRVLKMMWLIYSCNGNFERSLHTGVWGFSKSRNDNWKHFVKTAKQGDDLCFVESGSGGKVVGFATFILCEERRLGPIFNVTPTDEDQGWRKRYDEEEWDWQLRYDTEVIPAADITVKVLGQPAVRDLNKDKYAEIQRMLREAYMQALKAAWRKRA